MKAIKRLLAFVNNDLTIEKISDVEAHLEALEAKKNKLHELTIECIELDKEIKQIRAWSLKTIREAMQDAEENVGKSVKENDYDAMKVYQKIHQLLEDKLLKNR